MNHTVARFMTFFVHLHSYQKLLQAIGNYQVWKKKNEQKLRKIQLPVSCYNWQAQVWVMCSCNHIERVAPNPIVTTKLSMTMVNWINKSDAAASVVYMLTC